MPIQFNADTLELVLLAVLLVYYLLPLRGQNAWLLIASYVFVGTWDWQFALVLAAATLINFLLGRQIGARPGGRAGLLWLGIALNGAVLLHFKNAAFYVPQLQTLTARLGLSAQSPALQFLLPLGVSYYTLQAISYLVDVHRGLLPQSAESR